MTDIYTGNTGYNTNPPIQYNKKNNMAFVPLTLGGGILGAGVGTVVGAVKKVSVLDEEGAISDTFTKNVYDKYIKKTTDEDLKLFEKQRLNITNKINNVKNIDELKTLLSENKELMNKILAPSHLDVDSYIERIGNRLKKSKKNVLKGVENAYELRMDEISKQISDCWNTTTKKFEKASGISDELYKSIKKSVAGFKAKQMGKAACVGGVLTGLATLLAAKIVDIKKSQSNNY